VGHRSYMWIRPAVCAFLVALAGCSARDTRAPAQSQDANTARAAQLEAMHRIISKQQVSIHDNVTGLRWLCARLQREIMEWKLNRRARGPLPPSPLRPPPGEALATDDTRAD
jgi:hypothetical protein